ncbi:hypothetical protein PYCCODRAFT_1431369 [Trametes coccinea BRFM310]|uniref:Thioredoxin domain-containing protein n=1 Tax=Trametes coccinea (strain BRFM310) TaxID=1353009 RepID=A0A1Y2IYY5_TRAC3|nr:hypothetical protein PYCCODRAFT_1431369 [Trametes coccinea BRFM310]
MASLGPETQAELAVKADFQTNIWAVFQELYEDKWDQGRWNAAVARFKAAHDPAVVQRFWARAKLPAWDALEAQFRKGPPPFLRPGWRSPLLGKRVDLQWIDRGPFEHVKGSIDGWRDARLLIIEFWATWCRPCLAVFRDLSALARTRPDIKIITFNSEGIFTNAAIDVAAVKRFVSKRDDMDYPVYIDTQRVAVNSIFQPGQNLSIPLAFIITPKDGVVRWIGNPEDMAAPLEKALNAA